MWMPNSQYWDWFWTDFWWKLLISVPIFIGACVWMFVQYWYDEVHEQKDIDADLLKLKWKK